MLEALALDPQFEPILRQSTSRTYVYNIWVQLLALKRYANAGSTSPCSSEEYITKAKAICNVYANDTTMKEDLVKMKIQKCVTTEKSTVRSPPFVDFAIH